MDNLIVELTKSNQRFIILSQYRAGSTMLCRSLDKHPELCVAQEILHLKNAAMIDWRKSLVEQMGQFSQTKEFVRRAFEQVNGFKIMLPQLPRDSEIWSYLASLPNLKVIFLERKNILNSIISFKASMISNVWQKESNESHNLEPFYIDPVGLEKELNVLVEQKEYYSNFFSRKERLDLQYESLIQNWDSKIIEVQRFLNVQPIALSQELKKLTNDHKSIIKNYNELIRHFKSTRFNVFFEYTETFLKPHVHLLL